MSFLTDLANAIAQALAPFVAAPPVPNYIAPAPAQRMIRAIAFNDVWRQVNDQARELYPTAWCSDLYEDNGSVFAVFAQDGKLYRAEVAITNGSALLGDLRQVEVQFSDVPNGTPPDPKQPEYDTLWLSKLGRQTPLGLRTQTTILRQADNRVRWFSVSCTSVLNRVGEIDSSTMFDAFVDNFNSGKFPPVLREFFHEGAAFRVGVCDYVARDGHTLITSGLYDDSELARAEIAAHESDPGYWGESIGYAPTAPPVLLEVAPGIRIPTFNAGILEEISTLPESIAAALFTHTSQEVTRMNKQSVQYQAFVKLWNGSEAAADAWLANNPDTANRMIAEENLIARASVAAETIPAAALAPAPSTTPPTPSAQDVAVASAATATAPASTSAAPTPAATTQTVAATPAPAATHPAEPEIEVDDDLIARIVEGVLASPMLTGIAASLAQLNQGFTTLSQASSARAQQADTLQRSIEARLITLEQDDDAKRQQWLTDLPPATRAQTRIRATYRPRDAHAEDPAVEHSSASIANATLANAKSRKVVPGATQ